MRTNRKIANVCAVSLEEISFFELLIVTFFRFSAMQHTSPISRPRSHVPASPISRPHASPVLRPRVPRPRPTFSHTRIEDYQPVWSAKNNNK